MSIPTEDELTISLLSRQSKSVLFPLLWGHLSHTWRQLNRNVANGIAKESEKLIWLSLFSFPSPSTGPQLTDSSYLLPSALEEAQTLELIHGSAWLLGCSAWLSVWPRLDWWRIHTPRSLKARVSHLAQGGTIYGGSSSSPAWLPCHVNYRKGLKWGSGFSPGKRWHVSNPLPWPLKGLGCERAGQSEPDDLLIALTWAWQLSLQSLLLSRVLFLVTSVWSLSWGQVLISTSAWGRGHGLGKFIPFPKILLNRLYCPGLWDFPKFCPSLESTWSPGANTAPREESLWIGHLEKQPKVEIRLLTWLCLEKSNFEPVSQAPSQPSDSVALYRNALNFKEAKQNKLLSRFMGNSNPNKGLHSARKQAWK